MTTRVPFQPPPLGAFTFQPTLDGAPATATVTWNLFGQRWYVNLFRLDGSRVFTLPLIESPLASNLEALAWAHGFATAATLAPHGVAVGTTAALVVEGCAPDGFNGEVLALALDRTTLQWPLVADPGPVTAVGSVARTINMAGGYFRSSSLAFRNGQFEVRP